MAKIAAWGIVITSILMFFAAGELIFTDSNNAKLLPGLGLLWSVFFGLSKIFGNKSNDKGE